MFSIIRPFIFKIDPEMAHDLAIQSLKYNFLPSSVFKVENEELLETKIFNTKLKNPIGLAAGFDKSGEVYNSLFKMGFGFVEVGTITPRRQLGNPKPRVFRLEEDEALINRLGFNNHGVDAVVERLKKNKPTGFLGANIGPNKSSTDKLEDYVKCLSSVHNHANYITINISSPNTPGLRDLHKDSHFVELMEKINNVKKKENIGKPIAVKISPDIQEQEIEYLAETMKKFQIAGVIISNTTDKNRDNLVSKNKIEEGGLSGQPLSEVSNNLIKKFYKTIGKEITIIGVGGVNSGLTALEKIKCGASLVQLYTGMIYKGPNIVRDIKSDLIKIMLKEKIKNINEMVGTAV